MDGRIFYVGKAPDRETYEKLKQALIESGRKFHFTDATRTVGLFVDDVDTDMEQFLIGFGCKVTHR